MSERGAEGFGLGKRSFHLSEKFCLCKGKNDLKKRGWERGGGGRARTGKSTTEREKEPYFTLSQKKKATVKVEVQRGRNQKFSGERGENR